MWKRFLLPMAMLSLCVAIQPKPAQAMVVSAVECTVVIFPCPAANIVDAGFRANGVGILGANRFTLLPFAFGNADVSFTGTLLGTDTPGGIYIWGGGAATNLLAANFYLDVQISQNYVSAPGIHPFSEFNIGNCTNNTLGTTSGVAATLGVNGAFLPVMGTAGPGFGGDCVVGGGPGPATGFTFGAGPFPRVVGGVTNLTALAQFYFDGAGGLGQSINLPWGEDFPDPAFGGLIPTPDNLGSFGVTDQAPEPATFGMMAGAIGLAAFTLRKRKR